MGGYSFSLRHVPKEVNEVRELLTQNNEEQARIRLELLVQSLERGANPLLQHARVRPSQSMLYDQGISKRLLPPAKKALHLLKQGNAAGAQDYLEDLRKEAEGT